MRASAVHECSSYNRSTTRKVLTCYCPHRFLDADRQIMHTSFVYVPLRRPQHVCVCFGFMPNVSFFLFFLESECGHTWPNIYAKNIKKEPSVIRDGHVAHIILAMFQGVSRKNGVDISTFIYTKRVR